MEDDVRTVLTRAKTDVGSNLPVFGQAFLRHLLFQLVLQLFRAAALAVYVYADEAYLLH
jgi:hypothetical protein